MGTQLGKLDVINNRLPSISLWNRGLLVVTETPTSPPHTPGC